MGHTWVTESADGAAIDRVEQAVVGTVSQDIIRVTCVVGERDVVVHRLQRGHRDRLWLWEDVPAEPLIAARRRLHTRRAVLNSGSTNKNKH